MQPGIAEGAQLQKVRNGDISPRLEPVRPPALKAKNLKKNQSVKKLASKVIFKLSTIREVFSKKKPQSCILKQHFSEKIGN